MVRLCNWAHACTAASRSCKLPSPPNASGSAQAAMPGRALGQPSGAGRQIADESTRGMGKGSWAWVQVGAAPQASKLCLRGCPRAALNKKKSGNKSHAALTRQELEVAGSHQHAVQHVHPRVDGDHAHRQRQDGQHRGLDARVAAEHRGDPGLRHPEAGGQHSAQRHAQLRGGSRGGQAGGVGGGAGRRLGAGRCTATKMLG